MWEDLGNMEPVETEKRYLVKLSVLYLIAHGGILLILNAIYWDDWVVWLGGKQIILKTFKMNGNFLNLSGYLHVVMISAGPWLYRVLTLAAMFGCAMLVRSIAARHEWISANTRYAIVLLFLVLPLNDARAGLVLFPFTLAAFLFFLGWFFLGRNRLLALVLFAASFNTPSLLMFYALPMSEWYWREHKALRVKTAWRWAVHRLDFMLLPFVYWVVKTTYFKPYAVYEHYNTDFSIKNLALSFMFIADNFLQVRVDVYLLIAASGFAFWYLANAGLEDGAHAARLRRAGLWALALAIFPYCIVGAAPLFGFWESHNQLLMPLGVALCLVGVLLQFRRDVRRAALAFIIGLSLAMNIEAYTLLFQDWQKKTELVSLLGRDERIRHATLVVFDDRSRVGREIQYPFYEWNGLLILAYGDATRFSLIPSQLDSYRSGGYDHYFEAGLAWNAASHVRTPDEQPVVVRIEDTGVPSTYGVIKRRLRGEPNYAIFVDGK